MTGRTVSIVIVAWNNWPDLELAIESALCQSHQPLDVIVVDNSSSDQTPNEVPKRWGGRLRYVRQPNSGDSGAYNTGMRLATGEFVQFLDGDDLLAPNKIARQLAVFEREPATDVVYGDVRCFQAGAGDARFSDQPSPSDQGDMLAAFLVPSGSLMVHLVGSLFRKSALDRVGFMDESLYNADVDYMLRAMWAGCRFRYCPGTPCAFYRIRPGQMSADLPAMAKGMEAVWAKAAGYMDREPYHGLATANLSWARYLRATKRHGLGAGEAFAKLREARATRPDVITLPTFLGAAALLLIPGGRALVRSNGARGARRALARLLGMKVP